MKEERNTESYLLYRIARDYYEYDMPQKEIATRENISRPHVSRLLKKAKECGIVSIEIRKPNSLGTDQMVAKLKELSGLEIVEVVQSTQAQFRNPEEITKLISDHASANIIKYLIGCQKIGVGIGKTLYSTVKKMNPQELEDADIVPLVGVAKKCSSSMQCNLIVSLLADATKSIGYFTNLPIVVDKAERETELFVTRYEELKKEWDALDVAIVGLGEPYKSVKKEFILNEATDVYKQIIAKSKNVGDLLVTYFRRDGSEVIVRNSYMTVSVTLENIKRIPKVICLAGGEKKVMGILTAIENKYISGLVTDTYTANELIELLQKKETKEDV